jgi:hypothetical protein
VEKELICNIDTQGEALSIESTRPFQKTITASNLKIVISGAPVAAGTDGR